MMALIGNDNELPRSEKTVDLQNKIDAMRTFGYPVWSLQMRVNYVIEHI
jgi:hypothetical protein